MLRHRSRIYRGQLSGGSNPGFGHLAGITSEPLIQHLKANKLKAKVEVESIVVDALSEIEQASAK
jgi:hypothetical protein